MKKLSFGLMRLPLKSDDVKDIDYDEICRMVDYGMERGFNFFDSAYEYHDGNCDLAVKKCIVDRYPREDFILSNKFPTYAVDLDVDMEEIFNEQLEKCGVEYFDYYMLHALDKKLYEGFVMEKNCFQFLKDLKKQGKIRKIGISFHDDAELLERILIENKEIEFVLLQINYLDWINRSIQSSKCYKVAKKYGKEIMVMEPLKGGVLANLPDDVRMMFEAYNSDMSVASWGIRFAASLEGVSTVLSGMNSMDDVKDNISYMEDFQPLNPTENKILKQVRRLIIESIPLACTYCDYCIPICPENIPISKFLSIYNDACAYDEPQDFHRAYYLNFARKQNPATVCTECGDCEEICTQHLKIIDILKNLEDFLGIGSNQFKL
ncbi:MAG: aldo/keto reductase [Methanobrevibacter sp.]|uniref:aldo/keto reductase n=1 Tax=Methanobrevibacter sp. TaxID=66852 RepID=UPI0026DF5193|nr:aldo/keto reductase [Methanobrevibacter sp.]MDO5849184.1 aldo/keto reductase [Methanobrevibacter sp.]